MFLTRCIGSHCNIVGEMMKNIMAVICFVGVLVNGGNIVVAILGAVIVRAAWSYLWTPAKGFQKYNGFGVPDDNGPYV